MAQLTCWRSIRGRRARTVMVFDAAGRVRGRGYSEFRQYYPKPGWVEHDPEEIWRVTPRVISAALRAARLKPRRHRRPSASPTSARPPCCGTARTGKPVHRAIVWQDRRTAPICDALKAQGAEADGPRQDRPGDRSVLLRHQAAVAARQRAGRARQRAERLAFGTIDSWLIWKLTGGQAHVTDSTNASRTLLFNIHDAALGRRAAAPARRPGRGAAAGACRRAGVAAITDARVFGAEVPIAGIAGDQQAALFGQACFAPGMVKNTYGTGCFLLMYTGERGGRLAARAADHDRLRRRRPAGLRARGLGLRRRRGGAVAARRARPAQAGEGVGGAGAHGRLDARRLPRARLRRPRRAVLGRRRRAARSSA